jgi:hypothetical protein
MTRDQLNRLLIAPELIVIDVALAALRALRRALLVEHPTIEGRRHSSDDPPIERRARSVLRSSRQLQRDLHDYHATADEIIAAAREDDIPF